MTRIEAANWIPLLTAHAAGKIIQIMDGHGSWKDSPEGVAFSYLSSHYRIKPEPQRIWKFRTKKEGYLSNSQWNSLAECQAYCGQANAELELVEFIEVIK